MKLRDYYDENFVATKQYIKTLPDLQNEDFENKKIEYVGVSNFRLPLSVKQRDGKLQQVKASVTGQVSLEATKRGINMSRIIRSFYKSENSVFDIDELVDVLRNYKKDLDSFDANILMNFEYYLKQDSLRSRDENNEPLKGYQFYNVTLDVSINRNDDVRKVLWLDFIYSSACPCSTALSKHAADNRGIYAIPHSQRSIMRVGIEFDEIVWIEDLIEACRAALKTETLTICKREDEQAFAEMNGANTKFVEDAVRLLSTELDEDDRIIDYKLECCHRESLHSHDAISLKMKGVENSSFSSRITIGELKDMAINC